MCVFLVLCLSRSRTMSVEVITRYQVPANDIQLSTSSLEATVKPTQRNTFDALHPPTAATASVKETNTAIQRSNTVERMQLSTATLEISDEQRYTGEHSVPAPSAHQALCLPRRRLNGFDSPYLSRPRMKRRGAVSYDKNCPTVEYIRYLGKKTKQCATFLRTVAR